MGVVKILLERGDIDPDSADDYRRTPLSPAAGSGHVVAILLGRGDAIPNSSGRYREASLSLAARARRERVVRLVWGRRDVSQARFVG